MKKVGASFPMLNNYLAFLRMKNIIKQHLIRLLGLRGYQTSKVGRMPSNLLSVILAHLVDGGGG